MTQQRWGAAIAPRPCFFLMGNARIWTTAAHEPPENLYYAKGL